MPDNKIKPTSATPKTQDPTGSAIDKVQMVKARRELVKTCEDGSEIKIPAGVVGIQKGYSITLNRKREPRQVRLLYSTVPELEKDWEKVEGGNA